jgi:uncharacterized protein (DUF924 family)
MLHTEVLDFWFQELKPQQWFIKDANLDRLIATRFQTVHAKANACELFKWRETHEGRLAEIIVLDQFSRNMFRGQPESFASDRLALVLAQEAIQAGTDGKLLAVQKQFLFLPFMHSESKEIHVVAEKLFEQPGVEGNLDFERKHKAIIDRFGRFPHRNEILGRNSTADELEFLKGPGASF